MITELCGVERRVPSGMAGREVWASRVEGQFPWGTRGDTVFGYVVNGPAAVSVGGGQARAGLALYPGMYFSAPAPCSFTASLGLAVVVRGWAGLFTAGGPIEAKGRLRYIDGCSDTLLVSPPRKGDPCLNHLHFPPSVKQTMHTHPTVRVGVVARGVGRCVTPSGEVPLRAGMCWVLEPDDPHCFYTDADPMDVIAFHPDSDTGPADEDHPMVNRTMVGGRPANQLPEIRTTGEI